jgi:hypothetical protein
MPRLPSLSSKELVRLIEKGEPHLFGKEAQTMQYTLESWREKGFLLLFKWERKPWTPFTAKESSDNSNLPTHRLMISCSDSC